MSYGDDGVCRGRSGAGQRIRQHFARSAGAAHDVVRIEPVEHPLQSTQHLVTTRGVRRERPHDTVECPDVLHEFPDLVVSDRQGCLPQGVEQVRSNGSLVAQAGWFEGGVEGVVAQQVRVGCSLDIE